MEIWLRVKHLERRKEELEASGSTVVSTWWCHERTFPLCDFSGYQNKSSRNEAEISSKTRDCDKRTDNAPRALINTNIIGRSIKEDPHLLNPVLRQIIWLFQTMFACCSRWFQMIKLRAEVRRDVVEGSDSDSKCFVAIILLKKNSFLSSKQKSECDFCLGGNLMFIDGKCRGDSFFCFKPSDEARKVHRLRTFHVEHTWCAMNRCQYLISLENKQK